MPTVNVNIQPEILTWVLKQTQEEKIGRKLMNNIIQWLNGTKTPTFNQIEDLSKKSNIPLGYFFLMKPPIEQLELLNYRTIDSIETNNPSRNLIDTIREMENIQNWMKSYREDLGYDILKFVGSMKGITDAKLIADDIRKTLDIATNWYESFGDMRTSFNYIRGILEQTGVLVMMSGIVGKNTHRALKINEFRAFAMTDNLAPLIFINSTDSLGAKLFSLLHELVHIWIGEDDLYNDRYNGTDSVRTTEVICNAVAAEILVPNHEFLDKWNEKKDIIDRDIVVLISELAKYFHCGESVIARKALDNKKIDKTIYREIMNDIFEKYIETKENSASTGGNYYNTMGTRLDGCFVRAICESINMGRTSFTEAYRLTNTSKKTFSNVAQSLGGVEW